MEYKAGKGKYCGEELLPFPKVLCTLDEVGRPMVVPATWPGTAEDNKLTHLMEVFAADLKSQAELDAFRAKKYDLQKLLSGFQIPVTWVRYPWNAAVQSNLEWYFTPKQYAGLKESGYVGAIFEWDDEKPVPVFNQWKEFLLLMDEHA